MKDTMEASRIESGTTVDESIRWGWALSDAVETAVRRA